jgi:ABC-2 type transport system permease protein
LKANSNQVVSPGDPKDLTMPNPIPATQQFSAIAWLRWRLFANGFRRKGGVGELVARIIVFPIAALFVIGPTLGAIAASYAAVKNDHLGFLTGVFWGIFVIQIIVSINISPPGLSFDPEQLIRYPLTFPRYLTIRLFLGLLSASTIVGTVALLGAAVGATVARPSLGPIVFAAALALAVCNMLFVRMLFAWVDRWLSTRRAREIFTALIFIVSIGIQYANVTFNGLGRHVSSVERQAKVDAMLRVYHVAEPALHRLPPGLAGSAILRFAAGQPLPAIALLVCILLVGVLCLVIFAWRMHREYRGENLSEAARSSAPTAARTNHRTPLRALPTPDLAEPVRPALFSSVVSACYQKEWIYVRRNPAQLYGLLAPLAMVFIFAGRMGSFARTGYVFPSAVAYSVLGISALAYNILGLDASGVQFYFIAPISMRSVMLGKNLFGFSITAVQLLLVYALLAFTSGAPPVVITLATICWVIFASLVNATIGNMRSILSPKKIDPSKISRKQASQLSALLCIGILIVIAGLGAGVVALAQYLNLPWLPIPVLLTLAVGAFALYLAGLNGLDRMALNNRETLIEELSKTS